MKVLYLTSHGGKDGGGLFTTMTSIMPALADFGIEVSLMCFNDDFIEDWRRYYPNIEICTYNKSNLPILNHYGFSKELYGLIEKNKPDIIHVQGIWLYYSYAAYLYVKKHQECKLIIQPHGMLDEWAVKNSGWKKKIIGNLFENRSLNRADCIHALCIPEYKSIKNYGITAPIAVLPNGININHNYTILKKQSDKKTLLYIGRLHPKKGLTEFLEALGIIKKINPSFFHTWHIQIAGWDQQGYQNKLEKKVASLNLSNDITFAGPIFDREKETALCNADAFILPSHSEGLPMTVLEAWSYSLPVLMTEYCNIPEGFKHNAAIKINPNAKSIAEGLTKLYNLSDNELKLYGTNGYNLVINKFQWPQIAIETMELYKYLLGKSTKPTFVHED